MIKAVVLLVVLLPGCAMMPEHFTVGDVSSEIVYQGLTAYDYGQTVNTARRPDCYFERDPITRAIIGEHPSVAHVEEMWAAQAIGHFFVSAWLDRMVEATDSDGWRGVRLLWNVATIWNEASNVIQNNNIGLAFYGHGAVCRSP